MSVSVYNVYGSQNEFVVHVTRVFILHMRNLGQNGPLRRNNVSAVARIKTNESILLHNVKKIEFSSYHQFDTFPHNMNTSTVKEMKTKLKTYLANRDILTRGYFIWLIIVNCDAPLHGTPIVHVTSKLGWKFNLICIQLPKCQFLCDNWSKPMAFSLKYEEIVVVSRCIAILTNYIIISKVISIKTTCFCSIFWNIL